jgi:hypothetical protein
LEIVKTSIVLENWAQAQVHWYELANEILELLQLMIAPLELQAERKGLSNTDHGDQWSVSPLPETDLRVYVCSDLVSSDNIYQYVCIKEDKIRC